MYKKNIILLLLLFFSLFPIISTAQDIETSISADTLSVQSENNLLKAVGNVIVKRGDIFIKAKMMIVNEELKKVTFKNIKEFSDGGSIKFSAEEALLSEDFSEGIVSAAQVLINDIIKIQADEINIKNTDIDKVNGIRSVTSCDECENGNPLWYFSATSAVRDIKNKNITYRDVTLRVGGIPVGYMPYLRLPDPDLDRARGFLIPELNITSNLGFGIKLPYFIPIGDSRDILITPFISPKTNTLEYRYRQKLRNGDVSLVGAFSKDDIYNDGLRSYYKIMGNFKLQYGLKLQIEAGHVNDERYLRDYSFGSLSSLNSKINVSKLSVDKSKILQGELSYVRNETEENSLDEYYSLNGNYSKFLDKRFLGGNLLLGISGNSALNVGEGDQIKRPPSSATLSLDYNGTKNINSLLSSNKSYVSISSFVNSEDIESLDEQFALQYGASSEISYPMVKSHSKTTSTIIPKIMISYNGQEGLIKGDFFSGTEELSFGNIYSAKKHKSLAESEIGVSVSTGMDYLISWNSNYKFELKFASLWFEDTTHDQRTKNGLDPKKFNFLSGFNYKKGDQLSLSGVAVSSKEGETLNSRLKSEFNSKRFEIAAGYEFVNAKTDTRLVNNINNLELSSSFDFNTNIKFKMSGRYDLLEEALAKASYGVGVSNNFWRYSLNQNFVSGEPEKIGLSAVYDDHCTRVSITLENSYPTFGSNDSIQSLAIRVQLKPIASFTVPGF